MKCTSAEFKNLSQTILEKGKTLRFQAQGVSMYPFIRDAQYITIKKTPVEEIGFGDVICFCSGNGNITVHRVIKKQNKGQAIAFLSRGDFPAGSKKEEVVKEEQVIGRVITIEWGARVIDLESKRGRFLAKLYTLFLPFSRYAFLFFSKAYRFIFEKRKDYAKENKLLALFCRIRLSAARKEMIRKFLQQHVVDWDYIIKEAKKNGLGGVLYNHLNENRDLSDKIPARVISNLKGSYYGNMARNIIIENEAKRILAVLKEEGIKPIILKGIYLSKYVYENAALRPMNDIDLLIRKQDLVKVNKALSSFGYCMPVQYKDFLSVKGQSSINSLTYFYPGGFNFLVHVHWHIVNATWPVENLVERIDIKDVWNCACPVDIEGVEVLRLSYEHMLIFLLQHAFTHNFDRMILACDIFEVLEKFSPRIDWNVFNEWVEKFQISKIISFSFLRLEIFSKDDFPPAVYEIKKDAFICFLYKKGVFMRFLNYLVYFRMQSSIAQKFKFLWRTFFPPVCIMAHNFNISAIEVRPTHYIVRIFKSMARMFS